MAFVLTMYCSEPSKLSGACAPSTRFHRRASRRQSCAAFSLIEVVLAIGIVAVAFIPLLGVLPMGINASRKAIDTTLESQIVQQMTSQAQQTDFSQLGGLTNLGCINFDGNGNVTTSDAPLYKACFGAPVNTVIPGGTTTTNLVTVVIYVMSTRVVNGMTETNPANNSASSKYIIHLSNNGR